MKLILASNSRTRRDILDRMGLKYEVKPSNIEEQSDKSNTREYVEDLSKQKAESVVKLYKDGIILSADSIICIGKEKLEKPKSKNDAKRMMKKLSGKINYAITGVTIIDLYQNKNITFSEVTKVYFDELDDDEINWYVENEEFILERCGYSLAGKSAIYIPKIDGDYYNVLGLPINRIYKNLRKLGYRITDFK